MDPANSISRLRLARKRLEKMHNERVKDVKDELVRCGVSQDYFKFIQSYTDDPVEIWLDPSVDLDKFYEDHFTNSKIRFVFRHFKR